MTKYSIKDLALDGKRVFIRVDFNVPIKNGVIGDDTRVTSSLPTIRYALDKGATVVLASHLGRPKGKPTQEFSLKPVGAHLAHLLDRAVVFGDDCIGEAAQKAVAAAQANPKSRVVLLENLRFHPEEEKNDDGFARGLAALADVYVNDAFGAAHRAHASVAAIVPHFSSAGAGLLMENELKYLGMALGDPERPFVAVMGGAKVSDKIDVIDSLLGQVDRLLIGGAMAYTFFKSLGMPVGKSLVEDDKVDEARAIIAHAQARGVVLQLPVDHVVAAKMDPAAATEVLEGQRRGDRRSHGPRHRPGECAALRGPVGGCEDGGMERPDGRLRNGAVCEGHDGGRERGGGRDGHDDHRRRRFGRRHQRRRRRRRDHAHLHRRRRFARIPRRCRVAWRRCTTRQEMSKNITLKHGSTEARSSFLRIAPSPKTDSVFLCFRVSV